MKIRLVACATLYLALVAPVPALAAAPADGSASAQEPKGVIKDDKLICRRDKTTGSRVNSKKVCKTAQQWERDIYEQRQAVDKVQSMNWHGNEGG